MTIVKKLIIGIIKLYRLILSPWLGGHCRFYPTCSNYAIQAIEQHGVFYGSMLAIKRIACCHPWHKGGEDPVPQQVSSEK